MPRAKQVNSETGGVNRLAGVSLLMGLILGWIGPVLSAEEPAAETGMQLAPVSISFSKYGGLDYLLRYDKVGASQAMQQTLGLMVGAGVRAESFIWQPWLVQVGGDVNASAGLGLVDSARNSISMTRSGESFYRTLSGGARLRALPRSRFPFEASFNRSDNRREVGLVKTEYATLTDTFKVSQAYRNRTGRSRYLMTYTQQRAEDNNAQVTSSKLLNFDVSLQPTPLQTLQFNAVRGRRDSSYTNTGAMNQDVIARHSYRPWMSFSLATLASRSSNEEYSQQKKSETSQLSSTGTWRPVGSRLTMTGGVRLFDTSSGGGKSGYTGANLGANYALTNWFRLYGSVNVYDDTQGTQTVSSTTISNLSAAAQYRPNAIKVGEYSYNRFVAANLSNNTTSVAGAPAAPAGGSSSTSQTFSLRLQHGLDRSAPWSGGQLRSAVHQGVSTTANSIRQPSVRLTHGGNLGWHKKRGMVRLSVSDSRSMNGAKSYFQSINLQGSQSERLEGSATLRGNITINASRQGFEAEPVTDSLTSTAGLSYIDMRVFNTRDAVFKSTLQVMSADLLQSNDINQNTHNQGRYSWENELTYTVGKLKAELKGVVEEVHSSKRTTFILHVSRLF